MELTTRLARNWAHERCPIRILLPPPDTGHTADMFLFAIGEGSYPYPLSSCDRMCTTHCYSPIQLRGQLFFSSLTNAHFHVPPQLGGRDMRGRFLFDPDKSHSLQCCTVSCSFLPLSIWLSLVAANVIMPPQDANIRDGSWHCSTADEVVES